MTTEGGTMLIQLTATGYRSNNGKIQFQVLIDGVGYSSFDRYVNEGNSHKSVTANYAIRLPAGTHSIGLQGNSSTTTDSNDRVRGTVLELPF